jgi:hypothetical protein
VLDGVSTILAPCTAVQYTIGAVVTEKAVPFQVLIMAVKPVSVGTDFKVTVKIVVVDVDIGLSVILGTAPV